MVRFKVTSLKDNELMGSNVLKYPNTIFTSQILVYLGNVSTKKSLSCSGLLVGVLQT